MNWADVGVPDHIIAELAAWDRADRIQRALDSGLTLREMAKILGISYGRASQISLTAQRRQRRKEQNPIEKWLAKGPAINSDFRNILRRNKSALEKLANG